MNNNRKINVQLFADNNGGINPQDNGATPPSIDYESEYKKMLAERDSYKAEAEKQKGLKDKYASENADYKKKELDKMSDDEKKAKEYQDLIEAKDRMEAEIRTMKLEKDLLANGFTSEESEKLINANISITDVKILTDIINSKIELATKSVKAGMIKETTPDAPMGKSTINTQTKTKAQEIAEKRFGVDTSKIKEYYKKVN